MPTKKVRKSRVLIQGYLEKISSKIFSDYRKQLTGLVGRQHGVYALYKGQRLYYVGLATDLRGRVNQHLKDKHAGRWDKFSLYLVRKADHIKELEALIMRVASPAGNAARGRLPRAVNLLSALRNDIRSEHRRQMDSLLGVTKEKLVESRRRREVRRPVPRSKAAKSDLASIVTRRLSVRGFSGGTYFSAVVLKGGIVRFNDKRYDSLTAAAKAASKRLSISGWYFWKYQDSGGKWVPLYKLKKK